MSRKALLMLALGAFVLAGPVLAEEVVYFKNGTTMPIRSHTVEDDMVKVELDQGSIMAFPMDQVEKIENAGRKVLDPTAGPANQMLKTNRTVTGVLPRGQRRGSWKKDAGPTDPRVVPNENGLDTFRPYGDDPHPAKRDVRSTANRAIIGAQVPESKADTRRKRIGENPQASKRPNIVGLSQRNPPAKKKKQD